MTEPGASPDPLHDETADEAALFAATPQRLDSLPPFDAALPKEREHALPGTPWTPPKFGGLRGQLIAATVTGAAALVLTIFLVADPLLEFRESARLRTLLTRVASSVDSQLKTPARANEIAHLIARKTNTRVSVFASDGRLIGDSGAGEADSESADASIRAEAQKSHHKQKVPSEVRMAQASGSAVVQRVEPTTEESQLFVALARADGSVIRASRPLGAVEAARDGVRELLLVAGVMAIIVAALITLALSRIMIMPIREITQAADALAAGRLSARVESTRRDELGVLSNAIDRMANRLEKQIRVHRTEEARLRTILNAMVDGVFVTNRKREIVLVNPALTRLLGASVLGQTAIQAFSAPELRKAVRSARKGNPTSVELELTVGSDSRSLVAEVAPLPERGGVVGVLHDITEVRRADQIRRDFVANASHELRTPLTAIRGFAETLQGGALEDKNTAARFVDVIVKHTLRLQRLVDDLFALSRAESKRGPVPIDPVDLVQVAREVAHGLESQAKLKNISVHVDAPQSTKKEEGDAGKMGALLALANERSLDEIAVNLLDNAIKYTPAGGSVTLRLREIDKLPVLEVEDTGQGIAAEHLDRIFERFYRVDEGRARHEGGTGLGLAIVRHLAEQMRARIEVESELGKGTRFRLTMPRVPRSART